MTTQKTAVKTYNKKSVRKYTHTVQGSFVTTTCKLFGAVLQDEQGNFVEGCKDCNQINSVRLACQIASGILPVTFDEILKSSKSKVRKSTTKKDKTEKDDTVFESFVHAFKSGKSKTEIINMMVNSGMTEKASHTLFSKLNSVTGACLRPNLKDSTIYLVARHILHGDIAPTGDKSSIAFCTRVCKAWAKEQPTILKRDI